MKKKGLFQWDCCDNKKCEERKNVMHFNKLSKRLGMINKRNFDTCTPTHTIKEWDSCYNRKYEQRINGMYFKALQDNLLLTIVSLTAVRLERGN